MINTKPILSRRQKTAGPNHNLWNNHGGWWFHGTEHRPDGSAVRIRVNLRTSELTVAQHKREKILSTYATYSAT